MQNIIDNSLRRSEDRLAPMLSLKTKHSEGN